MAGAEPAREPTTATEPRRPPVTLLAALSIALVAAGVSYMAAHLPHRAPMGPSIALLALAAGTLAANAALVSRQREFAWWRFAQVASWALLAYVVIAGMIEYAFVYDHTRGTTLVVLTLFLATFTLNVPLIIAFTVSRFERSPRRESSFGA